MFFAIAGNVRDCPLDEVVAQVGAGTRPDGDQAALHRAAWGRSFLWLGTQDYFCSSGVRTAAESCGSRLLPFAELCSVPVDFGRGNREAAAGAVAGMARRKCPGRDVLDFAGGADSRTLAGIGV